MSIRSLRLMATAALAIGLSACQTADLGLVTSETGGASREAASAVAKARTASGLGGLTADSTLERAAIEQAGYMAASGRMQHTALRGKDFATRIAARGIAAPAAENLAHGRFDVPAVVAIWMNSPPHRRNMLDSRFSKFGLGYATGSDGRRYWTMVLGK